MKSPERKLAWLLRAIGLLDLCALVAVLMPREWHGRAHEAAGLGVIPDAPIVLYLTRSASSLYALYGALLLFLSADVARHLAVIRFLALAAQMTQWPPVALRASKRVLQNSTEANLEEALRYELYSLGFGRKATNDGAESRAALLEKRTPKYTGT